MVKFEGGDGALEEAEKLIRYSKTTVQLSVRTLLSMLIDISFQGNFNCSVKICRKCIHKDIKTKSMPTGSSHYCMTPASNVPLLQCQGGENSSGRSPPLGSKPPPLLSSHLLAFVFRGLKISVIYLDDVLMGSKL